MYVCVCMCICIYMYVCVHLQGSAVVQPKQIPTIGKDDVQISTSNDGLQSVVSPPAVVPRRKPITVCS